MSEKIKMIDYNGVIVNVADEVIDMMNYCNANSCLNCKYCDICILFTFRYNTLPYGFKPYEDK